MPPRDQTSLGGALYENNSERSELAAKAAKRGWRGAPPPHLPPTPGLFLVIGGLPQPPPPPAEEANHSDGETAARCAQRAACSADDGRPQYFIRNSDSSATSGDDSSDDSSFDSSGAGAESAGDSPQGKSDVVQSRQDGGFYPTRGRVAQNERDRERDEETERGV